MTLTGLPLYLSDALAAGEQPSARDIAQALDMELDSVRNTLRRMAKAGVIELDRPRNGKPGGVQLRVVGMAGKTEA